MIRTAIDLVPSPFKFIKPKNKTPERVLQHSTWKNINHARHLSFNKTWDLVDMNREVKNLNEMCAQDERMRAINVRMIYIFSCYISLLRN